MTKIKRIAVCLLGLVLVSCGPIRLLPEYDPEIEKGLNKYHVETLQFMAEMERTGAPATGTYNGQPISKYYQDTSASLTNLVVRAEAQGGRTPCSKLGNASDTVLSFIAETSVIDDAIDAIDPNTQISVNQNESDCSSIVLRAVLANQRELEGFHRSEGSLRGPGAQIFRELISDGVRVALITENAKK